MRPSATTCLLLSCLAALTLSAGFDSAESRAQQEPDREASVDLANPGVMKDIVSNALILGLAVPEPEVQAFLVGAESRYDTGDALLRDAAHHFKLEEAVLAASVHEFRHINNGSEDIPADPAVPVTSAPTESESQSLSLTPFARDVTVHVVLHELAHALIREFDLPVLANEETAADAFATYFVATQMPERAEAVITARTRSLLYEASELPREVWEVSGEHNNDARRAFQVVALALAVDAKRYRSLAEEIGMTESEIRSSTDYGSEICRSWRRVLQPLRMPEGQESSEFRFDYDSDFALFQQLLGGELGEDLETVMRGFDWHSQITLRLARGDGGAGWSRSKRAITIHQEYIERFVRQGVAIDRARTESPTR